MSALASAFCTPRYIPYDPREALLLERAREVGVIDHNGEALPVYRWGEGRPIILVHGWGARAAHMGAYGLALAAAGFAAYAFDGPGHSRAALEGRAPQQATLIAFGHVIAALADEVGPLYGLAGHSMGGAAASLAVAGVGRPEPVACDRLAIVSAPDRLQTMIEVWTQAAGRGAETVEALEAWVQAHFGAPASAFSVSAQADRLPTHTFLTHDAADDEVPLAEARRVDAALGGGRLRVTQGLGHGRTLRSPLVIRPLVAFFEGA